MMRGASVSIGLAVTLLVGVGCATPRASAPDGVTPMIAISPGVAGRLALMDRYRLHDEDRKHMMEKPHVWVEEAPEEDAEAEEAAAPAPPIAAEESAKPAP